ncbi:hypothetical protein B0H17DRAFT_511689 [Mycena rosella]|uniref:Uncharacterized protein n=1 Tax=Mycena rosella TaxID=1033263 RepID=A0AAD7FQP0_MYCRO|nr:hypothetical protein B0H17DRAFT_511689 [Mycena rosella]
MGLAKSDKNFVALKLARIFGFGYVKPHEEPFAQRVIELLGEHDVVVANRMNRSRQDRTELRAAAAALNTAPPARVIALHWPLTSRGGETQPLAPKEVYASVQMNFNEDRETAVRRAVNACVSLLGLPAPSPAALEAVVAPQYKMLLTPQVALDVLLASALDGVYLPSWASPNPVQLRLGVVRDPPSPQDGRARFRFTFGTVALTGPEQIWTPCAALEATPPRALLLRFTLGYVLWNERVMLATVDCLEVVDEGSKSGQQVVARLLNTARSPAYIVLASRDADMDDREVKRLVLAWSGEMMPRERCTRFRSAVSWW